MTDRVMDFPPPALRSAIAADLSPVRRLRAPLVRALCISPLALLLLVAAPVVFELRDVHALGWTWSWAASSLETMTGIALAAAALQEAVPGRSWSRQALGWFVGLPMLLVLAMTFATWEASPVLLKTTPWQIGLICLGAAMITALPATALTAVLALRALPTRAALTGTLAGLAGGLMADAGWRLFCHFSEPSHVLTAHLGGVLGAALIGALLTGQLARRMAR